MTEVVKGVVEKIYDDTTPKYTKRTFVVDGKRYGGFVNKENREALMAVKEGDSVSIEFTRNGNFQNYTSVTVLSSAPTPPSPASPGMSYPDKQLHITYLACRRDAIAALDLLQRAGKLDKALPKGIDSLDALIDGVTSTFITKSLAVRHDQFAEETAAVAAGEEGNE